MRRFNLHTIGLFALLLPCFLPGQIKVDLNPETIMIGDTASLNIIVTADISEQVILPQVSDSLNAFVEVNQTKIDTLRRGKGVNYIQNITLTSFEEGEFLVNSLPIKINGKIQQTPNFSLKVVVPKIDSLHQKIASIKPIMQEKISWWDKYKKYLKYIGIGLLVAAALALIVWWFLKELRRERYVSNPLLPPYEEAIENLKKLDAQNYIAQEKYTEYYTDLSFILRRYFARRFDFPALALLSSDLPDYLYQKEHLNKDEKEEMTIFLKDADLVKYAKNIPDETKHQPYRLWVEHIVESTRPIVEEEIEDHI